MTTPSTSVLVDGTSSAIPTSRATSVDGEDDPTESNATAERHLEHLSLPTIRVQRHWPTAASFNSSLDRLDEDVNDVHSEQPIREQHRDGSVDALATQVDGTDDHSSQSPSQNVNSSVSPMPSNEGGTNRQEALTHHQVLRNGHTDHLDDNPAIIALQPLPSHAGASIPYPPQTSTTPQESYPQASRRPSTSTHTTPSNHHAHHDHPHHPRRHRRLLRWLQRRVDHPLPWNLSLRRRTENVRRRILDVERLLP